MVDESLISAVKIETCHSEQSCFDQQWHFWVKERLANSSEMPSQPSLVVCGIPSGTTGASPARATSVHNPVGSTGRKFCVQVVSHIPFCCSALQVIFYTILILILLPLLLPGLILALPLVSIWHELTLYTELRSLQLVFVIEWFTHVYCILVHNPPWYFWILCVDVLVQYLIFQW